MNIPIIIVHTGDSFYLEAVLRQARSFNPNSSIYLISDDTTNHYHFIEHVNISEYQALANKFKCVYKHLSINPYHYELFCFLRWFIILEFVTTRNIEHFLCLDSDVLLYCNVDQVFSKWSNSDLTICQPNGPQYTLFKKSSLQKFCDFMLSYYTEEGKFNQLQEWHKQISFGGICDMTFFKYFAKLPGVQVIDTSRDVDESCFDVNMQVSQGFEMQGRVKKIYWKNNLPYGKKISNGKWIRFNALHFQGGVKHVMNKYLFDYTQATVLDKFRWYFCPARVSCRFKEIKKIFGNADMLKHILKKKISRR